VFGQFNDNEKLVLRHKMQVQTQQRTPLSNRKTRNETSVSINILLKLNKEFELSRKFLGREYFIGLLKYQY